MDVEGFEVRFVYDSVLVFPEDDKECVLMQADRSLGQNSAVRVHGIVSFCLGRSQRIIICE